MSIEDKHIIKKFISMQEKASTPQVQMICKFCKKATFEESRMELGDVSIITYHCGHSTSEFNVKNLLKTRLSYIQKDSDLSSFEKIIVDKKELKIVNCDICEKENVEEIDRRKTEVFNVILFSCGHRSFFKDGIIPRSHQMENWEHYISSGQRHQVQDDTGLGKTETAIGEFILYPESLPVVILCKGALPFQWARRLNDKIGEIAQVISGSSDKIGDEFFSIPMPRFSNYVICSLDKLKNTSWFDKNPMNSIVIDEIQLIKNSDSQRTMHVAQLAKNIPIITQLSGTPIENHAGEYYSSLAILKPDIYHNHDAFVRNNVDYYHNGYTYKLGGLKDSAGFFSRTRDYIIRHKMEDVKGLPAVNREFRTVEIGDAVKKEYLKVEKEFLEAFEAYENKTGGAFERETNLAAKMQKLRHVTGKTKVAPALDFLTDFLLTSNRKIAVYCHHDAVAETLRDALTSLCKDGGMVLPTSLIGLGPEKRAEAIRPFTEGDSRVLIAKLLSSGEGLDLNMCSDYLIVERHWNPKKEEQVEGRGTRLSSKFKHVFVTYLVGLATIDEFMAEMNERKREAVDSALDGYAESWQESDVMIKIGQWLQSKGKKAWRIS